MATLREPFALDRSLNTTESPSRNIADVLAEELSAMITAIGGLNFINFVVVAELPTTGISTTTIYLVPSDDPQSENTYDEYINLNGTVSGWEKIGSTDIDLSGYYTSAEVDDLLADKADVSDIPTVNDGTLTIQQNGDTKGTFTANQSGSSTVNIEIPTTDIQTAVDEFETYNGGILDSLKVALTPNQDLHGYDEPWVGGAGKNKIDLTIDTLKARNGSGTWSGNVYTKNGVTFAVLTDDDGNVIGVKCTGTASAETDFVVGENLSTLADGTYIANGCPNGGGSSTYRFRGSGGLFGDIGLGGVTFTKTSSTNSSAEIIISNGYAIPSGGIVFYPMIRLSTESDPTFEPYSNICPISGHTQVDIWNHQKNLCDDSLIVQGDIDNSTGADTADGSLKHIRSGYCNAESSTQYTVSHNHTIGSGTLKVFEYRSDKSFIRRTNAGAVTSLSYTFTTHSECKYIRIAIYDENGISKNNTWIQLELGSTATAYVPYNGYQVTVNLGGTYYSGTLDVVSGVFVPNTAMATASDFVFTAGKSDGDLAKVEYTPSNFKNSIEKLKCNMMPYVEQSASWEETEPCYTIANNTKLRVYFDGDTLADFQSDYADIQIVYELATPTPIQLSPTMVKALVGEDHLSAPLDGQEITESKYKQMFTFDDVIAYIQSLS